MIKWDQQKRKFQKEIHYTDGSVEKKEINDEENKRYSTLGGQKRSIEKKETVKGKEFKIFLFQ